ncbi:phage tail protein [Shewanella xiamenensis]|uniref:phage tail protein n=1 Tax=Shewanella xiamenensis TaxID=332186 RepID=UPI00313B8911
MQSNQQSLLFDIDPSELESVQLMLGGTEKEMLAAYNRAIARTSVTMKSQGSKLMRDGMDAKGLKEVRKRMQAYKSAFKLGQTSEKLDELKLWFGLNDMSIGRLKGRLSRLGSKRSPAGAAFTSRTLGQQKYEDGFLGRVRGKRSIFARKGAARFPIREKKVAVSDQLHTKLEDDIFSELPEVFMQHFTTDMKGRVAGRSSIASRQHKWNKYA